MASTSITLVPDEVNDARAVLTLGRIAGPSSSRSWDLTLDTRHRYFREVRCFFNWLVAVDYLTASPFAKLRNVRLPKKIVRPYTLDDVQALLAACAVTPQGLRDRAILLMLLDTGLRVSELAQLTLDDLDLVAMRIHVLYAKGTAYAFSAGNTPDRAARSTPRIQEDLSPDDAQDDGGPVDKAALIADAFGASPDAVSALHEQGIGWGALFKLYAFARVKGVSVDALIAAATTDANGEKEFAFGEMKKALTTEELAVLNDGPKNFGQMVSGSHKKGHAATP